MSQPFFPTLAIDPLHTVTNVLCSRQVSCGFSYAGQPCQIALLPDIYSQDYNFLIKVSINQAYIFIGLDFSVLNVFFQCQGIHLDVLDMDQNLKHAAVTHILEQVARSVFEQTGRDYFVNSVEFSEGLPGDTIPACLFLKVNDVCAYGKVFFSKTDRFKFSDFCEQFEKKQHLPDTNLPVIISIETGGTSLGLSDLQTVQVCDVILLDWKAPDVIVRISDDLAYQGSVNGNSIVLESIVDTGSEEQQISNLGSVPVTLVFEVARKHVTLQELMQVGVGYVFEFGVPVGKSLSILANGKCIGQGELVKVGDQLGARVLNISTDQGE